MRVEKAFVGAMGIDSYPYSIGGTPEQARALYAHGVRFAVLYLGVANIQRINYVLNAGMAFMPVTKAGEAFDGPDDEIAQLNALGIPKGCTVWLDHEGMKTLEVPKPELARLINVWAKAISASGYIAGLYYAPPQPFTGPELAALAVTRYWKSAGRLQDSTGKIWDEPEGIGHCMIQSWPQGNFRDTGVFVDADFVTSDRRGRVPTWVVL